MHADLTEKLLALETELLTQEAWHSQARLRDLLTDDFIEFGSSGCNFDKRIIIKLLLQSESTEKRQIDDFGLLVSSDDTGVVTYSCVVMSKSDEIARKSNRSSLWRVKDGRWQMLFHQGTRTE